MAKVFKGKRILFFINGPVPNDEEREEAQAIAATGEDVVFRNGTMVPPDGSLEAFDGLAGTIPHRYEAAARDKAELADQQAREHVARLAAAEARRNAPLKSPKPVKTPKAAPGPRSADPAAAGALAALSGGPAAPATPLVWKPNA